MDPKKSKQMKNWIGWYESTIHLFIIKLNKFMTVF
nr:MAG TPA: hypothetical protein [Caudoviricetes sp.]